MIILVNKRVLPKIWLEDGMQMHMRRPFYFEEDNHGEIAFKNVIDISILNVKCGSDVESRKFSRGFSIGTSLAF